MAEERVVNVIIPVGAEGGFLGGVGAMAALFAVVVLIALGVLIAVCVMFPAREYAPIPATRSPGACEPFCPTRTFAPVPVGGVPW